jgi:hypothetical protein
MRNIENYPYILKSLFERNEYENIVDSNILSAYIPSGFPIPHLSDPRKIQITNSGALRHPMYIRSPHINQIFNYIGFIKRTHDKELSKYLPLLFYELKQFIHVLEDVIFEPCISISEDIYEELYDGLQNFFDAYRKRICIKGNWVEAIWKHQKLYLEHIDMLVETLKLNGQVFNMASDPLKMEIVKFFDDYFRENFIIPPEDTDIHFVANVCSKAAWDKAPKTIWSGDRHIYIISNFI